MKTLKSNTIFFYLSFILIVLFSCQNADKKNKENIIGSFYSVFSDEDEDVLVTGESVETFSIDGTVVEKGEIIFTTITEDGDRISLQYDLSIQGKYEIINSYLVYDYDLDKIDLRPSSNQEFTQLYYLISDDLDFFINKHFLLALKEEMINGNKYKIVSIDKNSLVLANDEETIKSKRITPQDDKRNRVDSDTGTDFNSFIKKFTTDEDYQISHIEFPVSMAEHKEDWTFMDDNIIFEGTRKLNGWFFSGSFDFSENTCVYTLGYPESDLIYRFTFVKKGNKWMLVEAIDVLSLSE